MKKLLFAMSLVFLGITAGHGQAPYKIHTCPKLPMRESLERMNLLVAWNTRVSVDGNRDGIYSVQLIPGPPNQLVVQTYKGGVFLYDADNGDLIWKNPQVGVAYWDPLPAAFNSQSIFVTRRNVLHVLNRLNGTQRVYTFNDQIKQAEFGFPLNFTPNAAPMADEDYLYFSMGDRLNAYYIPDFERIDRMVKLRDKAKREGKELKIQGEEYIPEGPDSPQPVYLWGWRFADEVMTTPPLVFGAQLSMLTTDGTLTGIGRTGTGPREEYYRPFKFTGQTPGAAGHHWNMAYVGSDDFNLYAFDMIGGRLKWRHAAGAPILRGPSVNDRDVFVAPRRVGLRRIDRASGIEVWTNRDTERFLAANHVYVYALDGAGRFYVMDARRGSTLSTLNMLDWAISVPNEWTDRIYLAANDGQILCLRHRDLAKPLVMKTAEPPRPPEKKEDEKKEDKKEDKKDDDKEKDKDKGAAPDEQFPAWPRVLALSACNTWARFERGEAIALDDRRGWAGQ
jgi:outer membrane protein assembly factor BamB